MIKSCISKICWRVFTDCTCQRQKLQKGDFYFPLSLHFFCPWPLSVSPKYFFFPFEPRGFLWKQQRGRFPIFRMMRSYLYSGWFMPKFTAQFRAGVDFELLRCCQQEPQSQKLSTASETTFSSHFHPAFHGLLSPLCLWLQRTAFFSLLVPFWGEKPPGVAAPRNWASENVQVNIMIYYLEL